MPNNKKILWIEDDADIIGDMVRPIEKEGFIIDIIESLAEFKNYRDKMSNYILILLDLIIPQKEQGNTLEYPGIEVLKLLRKEWKLKIPVIALTVVRSESVIGRLRKYNVEEILYKPVRSQVLRDAVFKVLKI